MKECKDPKCRASVNYAGDTNRAGTFTRLNAMAAKIKPVTSLSPFGKEDLFDGFITNGTASLTP